MLLSYMILRSTSNEYVRNLSGYFFPDEDIS